MENKKLLTVSGVIFFLLLSIAVPFHIETTNNILEKHSDDETITGFLLGENRRDEARFRPRQYIRTIRTPEQNVDTFIK